MMTVAIKQAILPAIIEERRLVVADMENINQLMRANGENPGPVDSKPRVVLTFDGEQRYLRAILDILVDNPLPQFKDQGIELLKFAASASCTQQPADVSPCFMLLKRMINEGKEGVPAEYSQVLRTKILKDLEPASAKVYAKFLEQLPNYASAAFTAHNISKGWEIAGLHPFNASQIMRRAASWKDVNPISARRIMDAIPKLAKAAAYKGELTEQAMQEAVGTGLDLAQWLYGQLGHEVHRIKPVDERVLNQRRALWLNHANITQERRDMEAAKIAAKAETEARKLAAQKRREERVEEELAKKRRKQDRENAKRMKESARMKKLAKKLKSQGKERSRDQRFRSNPKRKVFDD